MSTVSLEYLQTFKALPLAQQMEVIQSINKYLMDYFSHLTAEIEEKEHHSWQLFANQNLAKSFGEDEPEYCTTDLKSTN